MSTGWWELIFLMFLMKIPIVYLCGVVWWAIRAEPLPPDGAAKLAELPETPPRSRPWRLRRNSRIGPHGSPGRRAPRAPQSQRAYAKHDEH